jgi:CRISPR-associated endonuclease Cas1
MPDPSCPDVAAIFARDARDPSVCVVDGHGLQARVNRGHLELHDGIGSARRIRRIARADRTIKRLVILGQSGSLTLEALRWCRDVDIAVVVIDPFKPSVTGLASPRTHHDARLRRAQALTLDTDLQLHLVKQLLDVKLAGQERIARERFGDATAVDAIEQARAELAGVTEVRRALLCEANAAGAYFKAWAGMRVTFAKNDLPKIPKAWTRYTQRTSILDNSSPRVATHPVNAIANYLYALAETEAIFACHVLGLDPSLGLLHTDKAGRDSLALDLLEVIRPDTDDYLLDLVQTHVFSRADVYETREGQCRLLAPLTHDLAETIPAWGRALAPHAEMIAHALVDVADGSHRKRRPLTGRPKTSARNRKTASPIMRPEHRCPDCGSSLADRRRLRCSACHAEQRRNLAHERLQFARDRLTELRAQEPKPDGATMRAAKASLNRAEADAWDVDHPDANRDPEYYRREILPGLQTLPIAAIGEAIGVTTDASWRIREGTLTPHFRHWLTLSRLTTSDTDSLRSDEPRLGPPIEATSTR